MSQYHNITISQNHNITESLITMLGIMIIHNSPESIGPINIASDNLEKYNYIVCYVPYFVSLFCVSVCCIVCSVLLY